MIDLSAFLGKCPQCPASRLAKAFDFADLKAMRAAIALARCVGPARQAGTAADRQA